jgi:1,4-alpha-glucan branching enzyme
MISLAKEFQLFVSSDLHLLYKHTNDKIVVFTRSDLLFAFNFHPTQSYSDYYFEAPAGRYRMILNSDAPEYGGHDRLITSQEHFTRFDNIAGRQRNFISLYFPTRTALIFQRLA